MGDDDAAVSDDDDEEGRDGGFLLSLYKVLLTLSTHMEKLLFLRGKNPSRQRLMVGN